MDRINHVKIVTPEPEAVDRFLREVLDVPEGWTIPGVRSDMQLVDWNDRDGVRAFFAEVGGIMFEVMRVEPREQ